MRPSVAAAGSVTVAQRLQLLCSMWHLPRPGIKPASPALVGGFVTTRPPGKLLYEFKIRITPLGNGSENLNEIRLG